MGVTTSLIVSKKNGEMLSFSNTAREILKAIADSGAFTGINIMDIPIFQTNLNVMLSVDSIHGVFPVYLPNPRGSDKLLGANGTFTRTNLSIYFAQYEYAANDETPESLKGKNTWLSISTHASDFNQEYLLNIGQVIIKLLPDHAVHFIKKDSDECIIELSE